MQEAEKLYAGTAPITRLSGRTAWYEPEWRIKRLADAALPDGVADTGLIRRFADHGH